MEEAMKWKEAMVALVERVMDEVTPPSLQEAEEGIRGDQGELKERSAECSGGEVRHWGGHQCATAAAEGSQQHTRQNHESSFNQGG